MTLTLDGELVEVVKDAHYACLRNYELLVASLKIVLDLRLFHLTLESYFPFRASSNFEL